MTGNGNPSNEEQRRLNPEFSLGERLATMEAEVHKDEQHGKDANANNDRHRKEIQGLNDRLTTEELKGVRSEMDTKDKARQDAIDKAEKAAQERAVALATELRQFTDQAQTRFGALERGGAGLSGEKLGSGELIANARAERAERSAQRATNATIGVGIIAALAFLRAIGAI
jgi:hypothetical protein